MGKSFRENSIGTDPTNVPIIETLDTVPKNYNNNNKENKGILKKIIFTVIVIILMLGVAGGLYFYLNLGQKNKKTSNFTLKDITILQGQELSKNVKDYGNFDNVDSSLCSIDLSTVNNKVAGSYSYSIKCYKTVKNAVITVKNITILEASTKLITKKVGSAISEKTFIKSTNDYEYHFVNGVSTITNKVGFNVIPIEIKDESGNTQTVFGLYNVIKDDYLMNNECQKNQEIYKYYIDYDNNVIGNIFIIEEIIYNNKDQMNIDISNIKDGQLTINNKTGYVIVDYDNLVIRLLNITNEELPTNYTDLNNYFIQKGYTCTKK